MPDYHSVYLDEIGTICDPNTLNVGKTYIFKQYPHNYGYNTNFLDNHVTVMRGSLINISTLRVLDCEEDIYILVWDTHGTKNAGNVYPENTIPGRLEVYDDLLNV